MNPPSIVATPSGTVRSPNPRPRKYQRSLRGLLVATVGIALLLDFSAAQAQPPSWPALEFTPVVSGLSQPVHITHAGDGSGRLFILEKAGRLRVLQGGALLPTPFLDISSITRNSGFEEGLLSVAFPPEYGTTGRFYAYFTDDRPANQGNNVLARFRVTEDPDVADAASEEILLTFEHPTHDNHNGGQIAFGPDGNLYIGTGDGGGAGDPFENAQDPASLLGKLLRIDVELQNPSPAPTPAGPHTLYFPLILHTPALPYRIPPDNPFVEAPGYRPEIWALGLRNPWRFSFDRATGDLYLADVGQGDWEEVNHQPASSAGGQNYGWPCKEADQDYDFGPECASLSLVDPIFQYSHELGCSVSGGYVYRGPGNSSMQGIYFLGDFCSGRVWGLQPDGSGWAGNLLADSSYNISTFGEDEAGNLYLADYFAGTVYQLNEAP